MLNKDEAITLFMNTPLGTYQHRDEFRNKFGVGIIAEKHWNDGVFALGIEYGMMMTLAMIFDITPEDIENVLRD